MISFFISSCIVLFAITVILVLLSIIIGNVSEKIKKVFNWLSIHNLVEVAILLAIGFIVFISLILNKAHFYKQMLVEISPKDGMGQFGDFFNGILAPFLTLISILFLYRAFKQQYIANNLFQNYELEKNIKEDLNWLREKKMEPIQKKPDDFLSLSDDDLKQHFHPTKGDYLRIQVYYIGVFKRNLIKINSMDKLDSNNLSLLKEDMIELLEIYYLSEFKDIFKRLNRYLSQIELNEFKRETIALKYLVEYLSLYNIIQNQIDKDNSFKLIVETVKNKLNPL